MGSDGCGGGPETDLDGLGWYGWSGMGMRAWGGVRRAWDWSGGPRMGVKGQGIVLGPMMGKEDLIWM